MTVLSFDVPSENVVCTKRLIDPFTGEILADTGDILTYGLAYDKLAALNRGIMYEANRSQEPIVLIKFEDHFYH